MNLKAVLEGLLFVVGEEGLTLEQIGKTLEIDEEESKKLVLALKSEYESDSRGIRIDFLGNKFKITTKYEHRHFYQKLIENPETNTLSQAALETLAIIAYNAGMGNVDSWIDKGIIDKDGTNLENVPYKETNMYLRKVLQNYEIYCMLY